MRSYLSRVVDKLSYPLRRALLARTRAAGSGLRLIGNSVPKSGTHLLMRCLERLPGLTAYHRGLYFLHRERPRAAARREGLLSLGTGCYVMVHLPYRDDLYRDFSERGFRTYLMVRDPRDVVVSHVHFVLRKRRHALHHHYQRLPDEPSQLMASIRGDSSVGLEGIGDLMRSYLPWREHGSLVVRFEHLVGPRGGGTDAAQHREVRAIAEHAGLDPSTQVVREVGASIFSPRSPTFREGQIGQWRTAFTEAHREAFQEVAGEVLVELGYEESCDW